MEFDHLNPSQREAALHVEGPLVVFAAAGSGKTRVITHRIAYLLDEAIAQPDEILAVTFTNKAAGEMKERVKTLVAYAGFRLTIGTFHSVCARLLRSFAEEAGVDPRFTIYDDQDQKQMVKRILKEEGVDKKKFSPKAVAGAINRAKQEMIAPDDFSGDDYFSDMVARIYPIYEKRMQRASALDFGDLIYRMVRALEGNDAFCKRLAGQYKYILVDEFQDTNHAQFRLVRALSSVYKNICVVGDDDQSIYRWRGADRRNLLDFSRTFPDAHLVKLEQNYRSTKRILRAAYGVIRKNQDRQKKKLWTDNEEGAPLVVAETRSGTAEAELIAEGVEELRMQGCPASEIAVFYRIHAQSRLIEEALRKRNIPYRIIGGVRFYDRAEVKDILAYLRVLLNPNDDVSLQRIINTPTRGIGKTSVGRLLDYAATKALSLRQVIARVDEVSSIKTGANKKIRAFDTLLSSLEDALDTESLDAVVEKVIASTGYAEVLARQDSPEAEAKLQNLSELAGSVVAFLDENPTQGIDEFLESVTLYANSDEEVGEDSVRLMTVHAAKGLEFDHVFIAGMENHLFPFRGLDTWDDPEELEEERRLAYVAITRARKRVVMTYAKLRRIFNQLRPGEPSMFLFDIPEEDIHGIGGFRRPGRPNYLQGFFEEEDDSSEEQIEKGSFRESRIDTSEGSDFQTICPGMYVRHNKFGIGEVKSVTPGSPARVTIRFPEYGTKQIVATYIEPA